MPCAPPRVGPGPAGPFRRDQPGPARAQRQRFPQAHWHDDFSTLPGDCPLLIVGNEFLDALPVRQIVRMEGGWRERMVGWQPEAGAERAPGEPGDTGYSAQQGRLLPVAGDRPMDAAVPADRAGLPEGAIIETCPAASAVVAEIAAAGRPGRRGAADRLWPRCPPHRQHASGRARPSKGRSLRHAGRGDLTALVDFSALVPVAQRLARASRDRCPRGRSSSVWESRPVPGARPQRARPCPDHRARLARLVAPEEMGNLFKAMAVSAPHWPAAAGFETIS
jgi:NADH dehydrogenase [ubiquinone] 1 alpha subcomplex assembly factor 7